jgi:hypothetical protein
LHLFQTRNTLGWKKGKHDKTRARLEHSPHKCLTPLAQEAQVLTKTLRRGTKKLHTLSNKKTSSRTEEGNYKEEHILNRLLIHNGMSLTFFGHFFKALWKQERRGYFMQDGATAHTNYVIVLKAVFEDRLTGLRF